MNPNNYYADNLKRFACFCPRAVEKVDRANCSHLQFCRTEAGELNLKVTKAGVDEYYHEQRGAIKEAEEWVENLFPVGKQILCVYGIGLGYYYDVLREWLQNNPRRFLVFIEDDPAVLHRFLETESATRVLNDTQVIIQYFETPGEQDWGRFRAEFGWFWKAFAMYSHQFSALKYYEKEHETLYQLIANQFLMKLEDLKMFYFQVFDIQELVSFNVYANLLEIESAGNGNTLVHKFPNIPVILCGAGPSLAKQFSLLPTLKDRAFIVGSGTGMNILTRNGILPHFGVCLDPYDASESRFMTSLAYEVPFFYFQRFSHKAFKYIHGPRLFLTGLTKSLLSWIENELGIQSNLFGDEGISTSNLCNSVAGLLGCNPIILTGMDLGYTDSMRYASGAAAHPTNDPARLAELTTVQKTIPAQDLHGEPLLTRWDWVIEAGYFTDYSREHPEVSLINATEGGMKILDIPNLKLQDVMERRLKNQYDLQNWLHCEIELGYEGGVSKKQMLEKLRFWQASLGKSMEYCQQMQIELNRLSDRVAAGEELDIDEEVKASEIYQKLAGELTFKEFVAHSEWIFHVLARPEMNKIKFFPEQYPPKRLCEIHCEMQKGRFRFFEQLVDIHQRTLKEGLTLHQEVPVAEPVGSHLPKPAEGESYTFDKGVFRILDPELGIDFVESYEARPVPQERLAKAKDNPHTFITADEGNWEGQALLLYPKGGIEGECYYAQAQLHGPSSFYTPAGVLVAKSWFIRGQRVGKTWQYYRTGQLYSLQRYREGNLSGKQEYYYPNGQLKTEMFYTNGLLDGSVKLYYPNGQLKREQHLVAGKLQGVEKVWNSEGQLIIEAEFKDNLPRGRSRTWYGNGQLAKEMVFYDNPTIFDIYLWDEQGKLLFKKLAPPEVDLDQMKTKSDDLQKSIQEMTERLKKLAT